MAGGVALGGASPAQGHFANFSDGHTFGCSIPYGADCYWQPTNAIYHSYGFVSANPAGASQYMCPSIWNANGRTYECKTGFKRYCYYLWTHGDDLDCHDLDGTSFLASVWYGGPYSAGAAANTTIHPTW